MCEIKPQDILNERKMSTLVRGIATQIWGKFLLLQFVGKCCTLFNRLCAWTHMIPLFTPPTLAGVFLILDFGIKNRPLVLGFWFSLQSRPQGNHSFFHRPKTQDAKPKANLQSNPPYHKSYDMPLSQTVESLSKTNRKRSLRNLLLTNVIVGTLTVAGFYFSLLATSQPVNSADMAEVNRAIDVLATKGFGREVFLLRHTVTYRSTDNWLNRVIFKENAFAATNFPFQMITLYPDFYTKATDDTERAMVLLHEAQHLQGADEQNAYAYVWKNRARLGWTRNIYGWTPTYMDVAGQTRENAPELIVCNLKLSGDCTEDLAAGQSAQSARLR